MYIVYCVCKDKSEAQTIATALVEKKLIACANMWPIHSVYLWEGKLQKGKEYAMFCKTKHKNFRLIENTIKTLHSYECPAILGWKVGDCEKGYLQWVQRSIVKEVLIKLPQSPFIKGLPGQGGRGI